MRLEIIGNCSSILFIIPCVFFIRYLDLVLEYLCVLKFANWNCHNFALLPSFRFIFNAIKVYHISIGSFCRRANCEIVELLNNTRIGCCLGSLLNLSLPSSTSLSICQHWKPKLYKWCNLTNTHVLLKTLWI